MSNFKVIRSDIIHMLALRRHTVDDLLARLASREYEEAAVRVLLKQVSTTVEQKQPHKQLHILEPTLFSQVNSEHDLFSSYEKRVMKKKMQVIRSRAIDKSTLKEKLLHLLALGPQTEAQLEKKLSGLVGSKRHHTAQDVREIQSEISHLENGTRNLHIKKEFLPLINPAWPGYTLEQKTYIEPWLQHQMAMISLERSFQKLYLSAPTATTMRKRPDGPEERISGGKAAKRRKIAA